MVNVLFCHSSSNTGISCHPKSVLPSFLLRQTHLISTPGLLLQGNLEKSDASSGKLEGEAFLRYGHGFKLSALNLIGSLEGIVSVHLASYNLALHGLHLSAAKNHLHGF